MNFSWNFISAVDCGNITLPNITNAPYVIYKNGTTYSEIAELKCRPGLKHNDGYSFNKGKIYTCNKDGQWKHEMPPDVGGLTTRNISECVRKY